MEKVSELFLTGQSCVGLTEISPKIFLHQGAHAAFLQLYALAKKNHFDLKIVSAYRSYEAQKNIWQAKAQGLRPLLDDEGEKLDYELLSREEILKAMLRWSAIPGASRHHWGVDFDVIDQNAVPSNYQVQLTPQETSAAGIFGPLHLWLDEMIAQNLSVGFFRPYERDLGGVSPEKWHLSFRPLSEGFLEQYSFELFQKTIEKSDLELKDLLLDDARFYYDQYVLNICP